MRKHEQLGKTTVQAQQAGVLSQIEHQRQSCDETIRWHVIGEDATCTREVFASPASATLLPQGHGGFRTAVLASTSKKTRNDFETMLMERLFSSHSLTYLPYQALGPLHQFSRWVDSEAYKLDMAFARRGARRSMVFNVLTRSCIQYDISSRAFVSLILSPSSFSCLHHLPGLLPRNHFLLLAPNLLTAIKCTPSSPEHIVVV